MSVVETVVGSGKYTYEVHEDWAKIPAGWEMPAAAVTVDSVPHYLAHKTANCLETRHAIELRHPQGSIVTMCLVD